MTTVQVAELPVFLDCPACGESYADGEMCECGYCDHAGTLPNETCAACGQVNEPTAVDLVAELLDAADCMVMELARSPAFFSVLTSALPGLAGSAARLRRIVTVLQGTAGLRVVDGGAA